MKVVAFGIPLHDGKLCWETWQAMRVEEFLLNEAGWRVEPIVVAGCSLVHIARNDVVAEARARGCDALLFIDGDMAWEPGAAVKLLKHEADVIAAACPRKVTPVSWNVKWLSDQTQRDPSTGLMEVKSVGTAFMAIKLSVFDRMEPQLPFGYAYEREGAQKRIAFFESPLSYGEDTRFCELWRGMGGKVHVDPTIKISHVIAPMWSITACLLDWLEEQKAAA